MMKYTGLNGQPHVYEQLLEAEWSDGLSIDRGSKYVSRCLRYIIGLEEWLRDCGRIKGGLIDNGSTEVSGCSW